MNPKIPWLAGLWDGEGSIGFTLDRGVYRVQVQMSMTHAPTIYEALAVMDETVYAERATRIRSGSRITVTPGISELPV